MPTRLVSLNGRMDIDLSGILIVVGRNHDCDVRVDSSRVSRRHCCLVLRHDEVVIRDLNSMNGTWVNGQPVEAAATLRHGDELGIAHLRYRLEIAPDAGEGEGGIPT
jgi:pSer/pThr/pTyr-binding forkhead associated (FHA) protein